MEGGGTNLVLEGEVEGGEELEVEAMWKWSIGLSFTALWKGDNEFKRQC